MQTIADLLGRHAGEEAWIFGKGPSLDAFDDRTAGPLRICINESVLRIPEATYFFAHDELPIQRAAAEWQKECRAILQPVRADYAIKCGIPAKSVYVYTKRERELEVLSWSAELIAREAGLIGLTGTVHSAIHFCKLIKVSSIVFVGMDGKGGYAQCIGLKPPSGGGQHDLIRRDTVRVAERLEVSIRFVN